MDTGEEYSQPSKKFGKVHNVLPLYGNEATMNLNPLILANIQGSSYFKVHLFKLKTYHEVVDEIYYQVKHLEPWERGSRKTSGQTGMCGGVRGVGAGGIVSTAFCLLYKLYTLRLTRKQVNGLMSHTDSPYIRALGFMYIRYTQPPGDLYDWYEEYLQDEEEVDAKAGSGQIMTIGQMLYQWLTKLDWFSTLFPRIPVPIQKQIERKLNDYCRDYNVNLAAKYAATVVTPNTGNAAATNSGSANSNDTSNSSRNAYRDRDRDYSERNRGTYHAEPNSSRNNENRYERRVRDRDNSTSNRTDYVDRRTVQRRSRSKDNSPREQNTRDRGSRDQESRGERDRDDRSERHRHNKDHRNNYKDNERGNYSSGYRSRSRERERDRKYR